MKKDKYPYKTSINLAVEETSGVSNKITLICFGIFVILLAFFVKFAVIDRISAGMQQEAAYNAIQEQLTALEEKDADYDKVKAEYSQYAFNIYSSDEAVLQDRIDVLNLLENVVMNQADISSINMQDNVVSLVINNTTLSTASSIVKSLEDSDLVDYVSVSTAGTNNSDNTSNVTASITVNLKSSGGAAQ